jgi:hypothetical protein
MINLNIKTSFSLVEEHKVIATIQAPHCLFFLVWWALHFVGRNIACVESVNCFSCDLPFFGLGLGPTNHWEVCMVVIELTSGVKAEWCCCAEMHYSQIELRHMSQHDWPLWFMTLLWKKKKKIQKNWPVNANTWIYHSLKYKILVWFQLSELGCPPTQFGMSKDLLCSLNYESTVSELFIKNGTRYQELDVSVPCLSEGHGSSCWQVKIWKPQIWAADD